MSIVARGEKILKLAMPPPEMIRPLNCSVLSTNRSLLVGTSIVVSVLPAGNVIGIAVARVYPVKSTIINF